MKKLTALIISLLMITSLAACGSNETNTPAPSESESSQTESTPTSDSQSTQDSTMESEASQEESVTGKTLVVYFSATGNTKSAANYIAQATGGDLFELEPAEPYTDEDLNYNNDDSRVSREHEDEALRDVELVADTLENWDEYDTVFIGYPIWWGIAAWPVNGFVEANDFTGKTVIPFATSASSDLGQSGELLAELAGTGDWQEGQRFSSSVSEEDIQAWVDDLGL